MQQCGCIFICSHLLPVCHEIDLISSNIYAIKFISKMEAQRIKFVIYLIWLPSIWYWFPYVVHWVRWCSFLVFQWFCLSSKTNNKKRIVYIVRKMSDARLLWLAQRVSDGDIKFLNQFLFVFVNQWNCCWKLKDRDFW